MCSTTEEIPSTSTTSSVSTMNPPIPPPPAEADAKAEAEAPDLRYRYKEGRVPEDDAIFPFLFGWARPLFRRAAYLHKKGEVLEQDDLLPLPSRDFASGLDSKFETAWEAAAEQEGESKDSPAEATTLEDLQKSTSDLKTTRIRKALQAVLGWQFIFSGFIKVINTGLQFSFPLILNAILSFIEDTQSGDIQPDDPWQVKYKGYWLSALLFAVMASKALTEGSYFHRVYRSGYQSRVALSTAVYSKSLRLANAERQSTTLGQLINLMQVDSTKVEMFVPQIHVLWDGMLQIIGYMTILYTLIGWPCFAGLVIMIAAAPLQGWIMSKLFGINRKMVKYTDTRVKTTNEALQGIQSVKMYTWEDSFAKEINKSRDSELRLMRSSGYLRGFSRSYMTALPGVVAVGSFVVYAVAFPDAQIKASKLFAALVAFDQLRFPLLFYPMSLALYSQAKVSAARIEVFLRMKEIGRGEASAIGTGQYERSEEGESEIILEKATVYWRDPTVPLSDLSIHDQSTRSLSVASNGDGKRYPKPALDNISMKVSHGELCAVVGPVASGKSTFCSAVLNEALLGSGRIVLNGKVAYAGQTAWVLNATLRDNILFGLPYDEEKYNRVIKACQLTYDIQMLEDGHNTEIGERGINLSGGQKQRVSIARAAYSDAQTIILDDPLSALDPEVAKKMFEECIVKLMEGRTRLLVTNQLQFVHSCDSIVALSGGKVIEKGTFSELMAVEGEVKRLLAQAEARMHKQKEEVEEAHDSDVLVVEAEVEGIAVTSEIKEETKALISKEERMMGAVSFSVYKKYVQAGGGYLIFSFIYLIGIICTVNQVATTSWVGYWTSDALYQRHSEAFYLGLYFMLAVTLGVFTFLRVFYLARFGVKAADRLHNNLLYSILHAPQSFFDQTPIGRIVSRFSKDLYSIDLELIEQVDFFLYMSLQIVASIAMILYVTPWFGVTLPFLGFFYIKILNYFREVSRETKRLESISRSPVYALFSETLGGLSTIRAYGQPARFKAEFDEKVDNNTRAYYNNKVADRWLSVRLETIGSIIAGLAAVFATQATISNNNSSNSYSSFAGVSLTFAISMTSMMNWCVRTFAQMEAAMNAVERVLYYTEAIPQEAPYTADKLKLLARDDTSKSPPPSILAVRAAGGETVEVAESWPEKGEIVLTNLKMRYRSDTPLVLKGLNIKIAPGERIGVVGRTGSGKSSLMLTLLRLVEPFIEGEYDEAPISIDGVDVLRIGLRDLRSKLGIIPQDPVLFSGTIRSNMDPFDNYTDEQIWAALDQINLKEKVMEMPEALYASVSEYGENLSAGTRQMLVMGRALLRQCKVLLLDEATSSVDYETDQAIQRTIREAFPGCTVITIAHRINTILDNDKILVMKDGLAEEFGPPSELLAYDSIFADIVRHSKAGKEHHD